MKLTTSHTSIGKVITVETDEELDLKSHGVFVDACMLAGYSEQSTIDVNLKKTRKIRGSGVDMLLMLRELTGCESNRIRLINCNPDIRIQLITSKVGQHFQVV